MEVEVDIQIAPYTPVVTNM